MTLPDFVIEKETQLLSVFPEIAAMQDVYYSENGRYQQTTEFNGDTGIYCHEYESPLGFGYILYAEAGKWIKAWDMGNEKRSFDWIERD